MAHVDGLPLGFAVELLEKAAEERETQAAWDMYVAMVPWMGKDAPSFAEYLDKLRKQRGRDVRRTKMAPDEIEAKFDRIVDAHLAGKRGE